MEENNDIFDDWFFNSFKRYHKLQMFGVDKPIVTTELSSNTSICLACEKPGENGFEVLNLELPNKLYQIENEPDSINTSRDLKIKCGTLTENKLIDIKTLFGKSRTILSEKGVGNVFIHEMDPHKSDQMIPLVNIESKIDSGHLAVDHTTDTLIIWGKDNAYPTGHVFDIENNKKVVAFKDDISNSTHNYMPYFLSKNELIVLNSEKGSFDLLDLTSGQKMDNINLPVTVNYAAKWFSNTMYTNSKETATFKITFISNAGTLVTYDLRNCKTPQIHLNELFLKCNNDIKISFDPYSSHKIAICGFDENVYVLEESNCSKNMVHAFQHEGHLFTEEGSINKNIVTSSILWLPMCGNNTLLSAANDGSIQGWQYIS